MLVPVIAVVGLLGLVAVGFSTAVRDHLQITSNAVRNAEARALANGGLELAVFDLLSRANRGDRLAGLRLRSTCVPPSGGRLTIEIADEAGKVDLNAARPEVIEALVDAVIAPPSRAEAIAAAILDYRDADQDARRSGAEVAAYRARGRPAGPGDGPFAAIDEIGAILDLSAADARRLKPWLTIVSGQEGIDPAAADPALIALLKAGADARVTNAFETSNGLSSTGRFGLPARLLIASVGRAFSVQVTVSTSSGGRSSGVGVIEFASARRSAASGQSARIKSWRQSADLGWRSETAPDLAAGNCEKT